MQVNNYNQVQVNPTALKIQQALSPIENGANKFNNALYGGMNPTPPMGADRFASSSASGSGLNQGVAPPKIPLFQFFDDPMRPPHPLNYKLANRLSWFGVNDQTEFLKAARSPIKRKLMSYLGGVFLNKQDRQYLDYQIAAWAGQADLMRTGVDLSTARLLQVSGAGDIPTLARYGNPIDKGALFAAMGANALQYGYHMPNFGSVTNAINQARGITPEIQW